MNNIIVEGIQWGVGHGGFHSQEISFYSSHREQPGVFRMIYDCGSITKSPYEEVGNLEAGKCAIDRYTKTLKKGDHIDLLVISHYDKDHVSCLKNLGEALTEEGITVRRIIAPLLTRLKVLSIVAVQLARESDEGKEFLIDDGYRSLLSNPRTFFRAIFPSAEVILLDPQNFEDGVDPDDYSRRPSDIPGVEVGENPVTGGMQFSNNPTLERQEKKLWELIPYISDKALAKTEKFYDELRKSLTSLPPKLGDLTYKLIFDLARDEHTQLVKACKTTGLSSNSLSVCMYSGPATSRCDVDGYSYSCSHEIGLVYGGRAAEMSYSRCSAGGWLGTGDSELKTKKAVNSLCKYYGKHLKEVAIVAVPHHGSSNNSCDELWQKLPNAGIATLHSNGKRYGHPTRGVLVALMRRQIQPRLVEFEDFRFHSEFYW